ncbi:hypothetical protein XFF6992_330054 [Xanthomonas citri pv. fuscans]|nr:hypothetical protein XFF6992_330054 [Xanthomonas citri pv. fuscans]SOO33404.1 hypothetical protein XFF6994_2860024 [Xanthomonas citri pv. fuscans]
MTAVTPGAPEEEPARRVPVQMPAEPMSCRQLAQYHPKKAAIKRSERRQVGVAGALGTAYTSSQCRSGHGRTRLAAMQSFSWPR